MSVDFNKDYKLGRNERAGIKALHLLWKRVPLDSACENVTDLIAQIQHCKQYEPNGDWNSLEASADSNIRSLVDLENRTLSKQQIVTDMIQDIDEGVEIVKPDNVYRRKLDEVDQAYKDKSSRQKYADSETMANYYSSLWVYIEDNDPEDDDSDIEVGSVRQNFNDPITLGLFENPYTSELCKHSYSYESIKSYLGDRVKRCPYSGCSASISVHNLKEDQRLAKR
ncbi:hypothetical protein E3P99_00097 [Wallemia hederae]|uniref:SP-RING-type domain-containing protein n=1 Tax=Wallemia hederae TaxID=1540922 RepID=A0A4V4LUJ5_9BASI|nr:hypothetical protein E3P99_00097 [Wallemia hederae]